MPSPSTNEIMMSPLEAFHDPLVQSADHAGRTLEEILAWDDEKLECTHDYIQTVFPLTEPSPYEHLAPVLDEETMLIFRHSPPLQQSVVRSMIRILKFYGFEVDEWSWNIDDTGRPHLTDGAISIRDRDVFAQQQAHWLRRLNHNHLRMSRIIRCLRLIGLEDVALGFYDAISEIYSQLGSPDSRSPQFWRAAMRQPLHIAPNGRETEWLKKYSRQGEV
ncbi:opioid growth factor receptor conserved domain-containing protein [Xylariaceae sp. FL0255]|nr:opioid growth factor receptor conserved domain-containing protein [Xylariaceae sp. FL0255]